MEKIAVWKSETSLVVGSTSVAVEINFHLGFTGLVQLRDGLFQLFVGGRLT
jgi:hypothetical protein